jgi:hypothetical protein
LPAIALLVWSEFRPDRAPDFLRRKARKYFDGNGLCFAVLPLVHNGGFAWHIPFQNRFERPCKALVAFRPAARGFGFGRPNLSEVRIELDCDGGAFGFATVPYGVPSEYHGKQLRFELIAVAHYPGGKGKMLRFRDGLAVGKHHKSAADTALALLTTIALHPHFTHSAAFGLRLPESISTEAVGGATQQIIWRPGDPIPKT